MAAQALALASVATFRNRIIHTDAMTLARSMPAQSIQTIITSPPYFGLRNYQVEGQIGLEESPEAYILRLVLLFRELRRALRDDGTLFLNLGDSYYGSNQTGGTNSKEGSKKRTGRMFTRPSNAQRATAYGTSGKAPVSYQEHGCLCENLCGVCREAYRRRFRIDDLLAPMLIASLSVSILGSRGSKSDHLPTSDLPRRAIHILSAIQDQGRSFFHDPLQLHAFQESTTDEFSQRLLAECWRRGNSSECLLCARSLVYDGQQSAHKLGDSQEQQSNIQSNALRAAQQMRRNQHKDKACECYTDVSYSPSYIQPYCTTSTLKPKDLIGIPWRVALALQADGWYLRADIIWHKPNPMPESVTDRPTKAHEYVFLLAKSERYYYDADAIKERALGVTGGGFSQKYHAEQRKAISGGSPSDNLAGVSFEYRNKRSVWTVNVASFADAHFATFPEELIEPMILAGSRPGDIVYDPFMGSGTTALVARKHKRDYIGSELNPDYADMATDRLRKPFEKRKRQPKSEPLDTLPLFATTPTA